MPLYEYVCPDCKLKFEKIRPLSQADQSVPCPNCRGEARKVMSTFACFSKGADGEMSAFNIGGGSCAGCSSSNCSSCGG